MRLKLIALFAAAAALLCPVAMAAEPGKVVVIPFHGQVTKAQFIFLRRALKDAEAADAAAVIIDMDTPGGGLDTAIKMMDLLFKTSVPTITYVNPNAGSAGALISLSTKKIYMAPVSAIGAAAPVLSTGGEIPETMNDKVVSFYSKYFRSAAERHGYNPDVAEAFINKDKEIEVGDRILSKEGSILTLSAQEAVLEHEGKPLLANGIAESIEEIVELEHPGRQIRTVEPAGFERLAFWLTTLAPLFLLGGAVGTWIEFKSPGFGVPGFVAAFCFTVFFTGHMLAGLAGYEVIGFFVLGLALVVIELLFFPGLIVLALAGTMLMLGTLMWTMVDRFPDQPLLPTPEMLLTPLLNMLIAGVLAAVAMIVLAKFLPKTSFYSRLVLAAASPAGTSRAMTSAMASESWEGRTGVAFTDLRPTGTAEFDGKLWDVVTEGDFVARNTPVRVVAREGMRMVVEAVRQ